MSLKQREFITRLRDAERLRLYVESELSARESLDSSLKEAQLIIRRLELEAKEAADREARVETKRDAAWHEVAWRDWRLRKRGALGLRLSRNCPGSKVL